MGTSRRWLKVGISVHPEVVEPVSAVFHQWGQGGVQIEEDLEILPEEEGIRRHPDRPVRVVTYLPGDDLAGERLAKLKSAIDHLHAIWPLPEIDLEIVDQEDWANAWKEHFPVHRMGRRTVIKPTWREYEPTPDDLVIELDPGMAFGTGLHPTTQSCVELIEDLAVAGARALDLGTGSGILAIQLARLGAASVDAWEVDETAVAVAEENARANRVEGVVHVRRASLASRRPDAAPRWAVERPEAVYDLIVANIIANVIIDLAPALQSALHPGGDAVVSGIIQDRVPEVDAALRDAGLTEVQRIERGDWHTIRLRRPEEDR